MEKKPETKTPVVTTMVPEMDKKENSINARSPFLRFQDKNGDKLPDNCDVDIIPAANVCVNCKPNPKAIVRNWRKRENYEVLLNEKLCKYEISYITDETTTGFVTGMSEEQSRQALNDIYEKYQEDAVERILDNLGKESSVKARQSVLNQIQYTDFHLEPIPKSRLQLLYSVDFDTLFVLDDDESDGSEEEEAERADDIRVTYSTEDMIVKSIRVRKGLNLHSRFYKVYRAVDGGQLKFEKDRRIFNLEDYGDSALFIKDSAIGNLIKDLDMFLNQRNFNLPGVGNMFNARGEKVIKLQFLFDPEYNLKKLKVYTEGCGTGRPKKTFNRKKLRYLIEKPSWRDKTAVAYLSKLNQMERDLAARRPKPWLEFVTEHTYPKVFATTPEIDDEFRQQKISTCIADALANDFKELGQDIFDEVFSLGDAIAYAFHKRLCRDDVSQVVKDKFDTGTGQDNPTPGADENILGMAMMQAYQEVEEKDAVFAAYCLRMLAFRGSGSPLQQLDTMWAQGFGRIKICGLLDLLQEAIKCLFKGISLEDALASIIKSALQAMGVEDFGALFVGLPQDKRDELDALVKQKIKSGNIFPPNSPGQSASDTIAQAESTNSQPFVGKFELKYPWENEEFVEAQKNNMREDNYGNMSPSNSATHTSAGSEPPRRTLAKQITSPVAGGNQPDPSNVLQAYAMALIEVYQDNLFALIDELDKFPGAKIISTIIALMDCPAPPLMNPGIMDFVKSLELPFCRNTQEIVIPRFDNPFKYIPSLADILKYLFEVLKIEIIKLVLRIIVLILVKICEIIGDAICKALETVGSIAASLPSLLTGRENLASVIRETICGPDASQEQVEQTALDLLDQFGVGGAALADPERALDFFSDAINSMTREEALNAVLVGPTDASLTVMNNLIDLEFQEYREAFPNKNSLSRFFKNVGTVIPAKTRDEIKQALEFSATLGELDFPANPSLCATPEERDKFDKDRCAILEGRMSPSDCEAQNESLKDQILEDLGDLGKILHEGVGPIMEANMPPIFSDAGCENGLLPLEPKEMQSVSTATIKGDMEKLQVAFTKDMLGNGGLFAGKDDWGFVNMILSDTMGNPYTVHQRKTFAKDTFVDFYVENENDVFDDTATGRSDARDAYPDYAKLSRQRGAFPQFVAEWLRYQYKGSNGATDLKESPAFVATNDIREKRTINLSFKKLGFTGLFGKNVDLASTPDFGYNVTTKVNFDKERVAFIRNERKDTPDKKLIFRDNNKGNRKENKSSWGYGFNLSAFYSDLAMDSQIGSVVNRRDDNVRIVITEKINQNAMGVFEKKLQTQQEKRTDLTGDTSEGILSYRKFEFIAIDDGLKNVDFDKFPELLKSFETFKSIPPQIRALADLVDREPNNTLVTFYNSLQDDVYDSIKTKIGDNSKAWEYGAVFDDLTPDDLDYLIPPGSNPLGGSAVGDPYEELKIRQYNEDGDPDGIDFVKDEDGILGISRYQYEVDNGTRDGPNRVFYLNPAQHGGNYMNPPLYIAPLKSHGWLGLTELMFPDYTPCKPRSTNLVGFDDINEMIDTSYPRIPEDKRLKDDPDCIEEVPFNRILSRPSRAGIQGLIMAVTRIFAATHFIKTLPVFSTFAPRFPSSFSRIYAAYIVERMEESLRGAGNNFMSPFKDDEFWYAFLEQAVQTYGRRVDDDADDGLKPENVPLHVQEALDRLNNLQSAYGYPYRDDLKRAKESNDAGTFETLKSYRESKNLEAVQLVDEDCKLILQELVIEQLDAMGKRFEEKLKKVGFDPLYEDSDFFFFDEFVAGGISLNLGSEYVETANSESGLITDPGESGYTTGGELSLADGTEYIGDYHLHIDSVGDMVYMVGPEHVDTTHDMLVPFAKNMQVSVKKDQGATTIPIGDIEFEPLSGGKQFYMSKYILVDGEKTESSVAEAEIRARNSGIGKISDFYPGSLKLISDPLDPNSTVPVGIEGDLGVQYALEFGAFIGGFRKPIVTTTINALDLPLTKFEGIKADSKILLCLINNLRDEPKFRMTVDYIVGLKKSLAINAIYCDMAFMPSIGEFTVSAGDTYGFMQPNTASDKPGMRTDGVSVTGTKGWAAEQDRNGFFGSPFFLKWDEWDQQLLRNTCRVAKRIFRPYYRKRKFDPEGDDGPGAGDIFTKSLKERFRMNPGGNFLPWWKRNRLRTSPFNNKGALCKKED